MAKRLKITKKQMPFLKEDLNLDPQVVAKLQSAQADFANRFKDRIDDSRKDALELYTAKLTALKKAKTEAARRYTAEIKKYENLIKQLKERDKTSARKTRGRKTTTKKK